MSDLGIGALLDNIRLIIQSNPDRLNDFAERWARVGGAVQGQASVVNRGITDVEYDSSGQMAKQMTRYRLQMGDGMAKLGDASMEVADALRQAAPRLAAIRKDLIAAAIGAGLTGAALLIPVVGEVLTGLIGGGEIVTIVNLINDYNTEMTALGGTFTTAQAKMQALDTLNSAGGVLPDAPQVSPDGTSDTTAPGGTSPDGTAPGGTSPGGTASDGTAPDGTAPDGTTPNSTAPNSTTPNSTTPGGVTPSSTVTATPSATTPSDSLPGNDSPADVPAAATGNQNVAAVPDPSLSSSATPVLDTPVSPVTPAGAPTLPSQPTPSSFAAPGQVPGIAPGGAVTVGAPRLARDSVARSERTAAEPAPTLPPPGPQGGSSGGAAGGGFMPPMMPPMMPGGGQGAGGIRPGEASAAGGSGLRPGGRDARRAGLRPQLLGRARETGVSQGAPVFPPSDGELLDEELWQVADAAPPPEPAEPSPRTRSARGR